MRCRYREFDGRPFAFQDDLELASVFLDLVLTWGDEALWAAAQLELDPEHSDLLKQLLDQGLLEKVRGRFRLTPRAVAAMQKRALMEVFSRLRPGTHDGHPADQPGATAERLEGTRPYQFGDPVSEIDIHATLRNALRRAARPRDDRTERGHGRLLPLRLAWDDFERHEAEAQSSCSTVVLIDCSGSMGRFGRYVQAKKCAMALTALVRQRFPFDTVDLIGFATGAEPIPEERLPLLMPRPVTLHDPQIRMRVPLHRIDQAPPHFTNLHLGLLKAARLLERRGGENRMIFIITDGQPTAHVQGDYVYLIYPPNERSHVVTLREAFLIARRGVRICTFALTDDYWDMDWLGFVDELGRLTRGVTFHCSSGDLSACVMESYLSGRRRRTYLS